MTESDSDYSIDITDQICPMTFVKTKLMLEKLGPGQTLAVRLQGVEPLNNVPRNAKDHGYEIVYFEPENSDGPEDGVHLLVLKKGS